MNRNSQICPSCPVDLAELTHEEQELHREYHRFGCTWKAGPSQDVKPSYGDINESRNETARVYVGWKVH